MPVSAWLLLKGAAVRADIVRIKASQVQPGDTVAFYSPRRDCDAVITSIEKRADKKIVFNGGKHGLVGVKPSDYVFIVKGDL